MDSESAHPSASDTATRPQACSWSQSTGIASLRGNVRFRIHDQLSDVSAKRHAESEMHIPVLRYPRINCFARGARRSRFYSCRIKPVRPRTTDSRRDTLRFSVCFRRFLVRQENRKDDDVPSFGAW